MGVENGGREGNLSEERFVLVPLINMPSRRRKGLEDNREHSGGMSVRL